MFNRNMFRSKSGFFNFFRQKPKQFDLSKQDALIRCPRCQIDMRKITRSGITIDVCDNCHGMWLDNGELERLRLLNETDRFSDPESVVESTDSNMTADEKELTDVIPTPADITKISTDLRKVDEMDSRFAKGKRTGSRTKTVKAAKKPKKSRTVRSSKKNIKSKKR